MAEVHKIDYWPPYSVGYGGAGGSSRYDGDESKVASSTKEFRLTVHGEPVAKGRPKLATVRGRAMAFTPKKTRNYEDIVRHTAVREWNSAPVLRDVPIRLSAKFFRSIPASWSAKKQQAALAGLIRPITRPDWDNLGKSITDALNGVVYLDDALIVSSTVEKFYAVEPRVEIILCW